MKGRDHTPRPLAGGLAYGRPPWLVSSEAGRRKRKPPGKPVRKGRRA